MHVERSLRRHRTASAGIRDDRLVVRLPAHADAAEEARLVETLVARLRRRALAPPPPVPGLPDDVPPRATDGPRDGRGDRWLVDLADDVADRWLACERAAHVDWSGRMSTRWGSCTIATGRIRISRRLADAPLPVLRHLVFHEVAHLVESGHGPRFAALMARDPDGPAVDRWLERRSALTTARVLRRDGLLVEPDGPTGAASASQDPT